MLRGVKEIWYDADLGDLLDRHFADCQLWFFLIEVKGVTEAAMMRKVYSGIGKDWDEYEWFKSLEKLLLEFFEWLDTEDEYVLVMNKKHRFNNELHVVLLEPPKKKD